MNRGKAMRWRFAPALLLIHNASRRPELIKQLRGLAAANGAAATGYSAPALLPLALNLMLAKPAAVCCCSATTTCVAGSDA
jgi:hypothetical protein